MKTYRYRGHSMSDPAKYRTKEEVDEVKKTRDPIDHLREVLDAKGWADEPAYKAIDAEVKAIVAGYLARRAALAPAVTPPVETPPAEAPVQAPAETPTP